MIKSRIPLYDYAKLLAAYLVILAHLVPDPYSVVIFIYTFHMPLFFIVSGMLGGKHCSSSFLQDFRRYSRKLLLPVITYTLVFIAATILLYQYGMFNLKADAGITLGSNVFETIYRELVHNVVQLWQSGKMSAVTMWFLFALFYSCVLNRLANIDRLCKMLVWLFVAVVTVYSSVYGMLPLYISQGCIAYIFYYIGTLMNGRISEHLKTVSLKSSCMYFVIATVVTVAIAIINGPVSIRVLIYGNVLKPYNIPVFIAGGVSGTMMLLYFSAMLPQSQRVSRLGNSLMNIMGFQFIFIYIYKYAVGYGQNLVISGVAALIIMLLCCLPNIFILSLHQSNINYNERS